MGVIVTDVLCNPNRFTDFINSIAKSVYEKKLFPENIQNMIQNVIVYNLQKKYSINSVHIEACSLLAEIFEIHIIKYNGKPPTFKGITVSAIDIWLLGRYYILFIIGSNLFTFPFLLKLFLWHSIPSYGQAVPYFDGYFKTSSDTCQYMVIL